MDLELKRPDDRLTIMHQGKERELFMSFLRKNSCIRVLGEFDRLPTMLLDPNISEMVLQVMLAEKAGPGQLFEHELKEDELSADEVDRILLWVHEHLTYFFMMRFQQLGEQTKELGPVAERLKSSMTGSPVSSSNEASAGPST